ncbi:MAG TPA: hypothetical protein VJY62_20545 [Bacteroidia bacterium]|nr:hypothetical protein [Bacteroidia bacterium]
MKNYFCQGAISLVIFNKTILSMQFLYVLTTNGRDDFINMNYLSAALLRYNHPEAKIFVACDNQSAELLKQSKHSLLKLVNGIIECSTPDGNPVWRNRYVKCRMRQLLKGDFLYLDGDTLPIKPLHELFETNSDFAAASNHSTSFDKNFANRERKIFVDNGWKLPNAYYVNGGVLFWRDSKKSHELSELYINKWTEASINNLHFDQPSLNSALIDWDQQFTILSNKYNAQYMGNCSAAIDASIWHPYMSMKSDSPPDYFKKSIKMLKKSKELKKKYLQRIVNSRIPFVTGNKKNEKKLIVIIENKGKLDLEDYYKFYGNFFDRMWYKLFKKINYKSNTMLLRMCS